MPESYDPVRQMSWRRSSTRPMARRLMLARSDGASPHRISEVAGNVQRVLKRTLHRLQRPSGAMASLLILINRTMRERATVFDKSIQRSGAADP